MLEAIAAAESYCRGLDAESFRHSGMVVDAVLRNLTVIGEAAASLPDEVCVLAPAVPWSDVRGMRNVLVHEYFGVSLEIVWQTVQEDLPLLREQLSRLLKLAPHDEPHV
jgi:uncharacterized protein with HEPN domain